MSLVPCGVDEEGISGKEDEPKDACGANEEGAMAGDAKGELVYWNWWEGGRGRSTEVEADFLCI